MCTCDPAAQHSLRCEDSPIFWQTATTLGVGWDDPAPLPDPFWFGRWVCFNPPNRTPHYGGPINGFRHYCPGMGGVVG